MLKKIFILFKMQEDWQFDEIISRIHHPPFIIKVLLNIFAFSFSKKNDQTNNNLMKINP